jgi:hypothetical protein
LQIVEKEKYPKAEFLFVGASKIVWRWKKYRKQDIKLLACGFLVFKENLH